MTTPPSSGRHAGKRLSPWRVLVGVLIALTVVSGIVVVPWYLLQSGGGDTAPAGPRWFGGYFDVTAAHVSAAPTSDGVGDGVVLAFVVAESADSCKPSWGGAYSLTEAGRTLDLDRRIDRMRRDGAHVAVSFGGALNTELGGACRSVGDLRSAYASVLDRYSIDTIDLDLENRNLADAVAGERRAQAVAELQDRRRAAGGDLAVWLTLPVGTDGLTVDGLRAVRQLLQAGVDLAGVNAMTMDYGVDLGKRSLSDVSIGALESVHDQLGRIYDDLRIDLPANGAWAVMGTTPMIGQNDVPDEVFTLKDAERLNAFAQKQHLARISMWSINRDRTCGPNYPDATVVSDSCSGVQQDGQTFAAVLRAGFTGAPVDDATDAPTPAPTAQDDPATAPYPIWSPDRGYSAGVRVVWHGYVYVAKWWVTGGAQPDDPTPAADQTSWTLVGPVMADDAPFALPAAAPGGAPEWSADQVYEKGARIVHQGVPYRAKWWTRGDDPVEGITDHDRSPWEVVSSTPSPAPPTSAPSP